MMTRLPALCLLALPSPGTSPGAQNIAPPPEPIKPTEAQLKEIRDRLEDLGEKLTRMKTEVPQAEQALKAAAERAPSGSASSASAGDAGAAQGSGPAAAGASADAASARRIAELEKDPVRKSKFIYTMAQIYRDKEGDQDRAVEPAQHEPVRRVVGELEPAVPVHGLGDVDQQRVRYGIARVPQQRVDDGFGVVAGGARVPQAERGEPVGVYVLG